MENKQIIEKIKKLMAIANDPGASDQEIQTSTYRARKLMIEHKIKEIDLYGEEQNKEVIRIQLEGICSGYFIWILNVLAENFRCKGAYIGKINSDNCRFALYGLKDDIEICQPVAEALIYYIRNLLIDIKESYVESTDFRIYKRNYIDGFSDGLSLSLQKAFLEMKVDKKYELAIIGVPAIVNEEYELRTNKKRSHFINRTMDGYDLGKKHGVQYDIKDKDLLINQ